MMRSKFSDSQIVDAVKRVEAGIGVWHTDRNVQTQGVSTGNFYF